MPARKTLYDGAPGTRIRNRRIDCGFKSQQDLADALGLHQATISKLELGQIQPRRVLRLALAATLRCQVEDLFPDEAAA